METKEEKIKVKSIKEKKKTTKPKDNKNDEKIKKLEEEKSILNDKLLRVTAEMQNMKRRYEDEISKIYKYDGEKLVISILSIVDNFERAIKLDDYNLNDELSKFLAGFKILYSHLIETLKKFGVEEIETVDKPFDPKLHEALMVGNDKEKPDDVVIECLLKGYTLKGKVIRPAKVMVNKLD